MFNNCVNSQCSGIKAYKTVTLLLRTRRIRNIISQPEKVQSTFPIMSHRTSTSEVISPRPVRFLHTKLRCIEAQAGSAGISIRDSSTTTTMRTSDISLEKLHADAHRRLTGKPPPPTWISTTKNQHDSSPPRSPSPTAHHPKESGSSPMSEDSLLCEPNEEKHSFV